MPGKRSARRTMHPASTRTKNTTPSVPSGIFRAIRKLRQDHRSGSASLALQVCNILSRCTEPASGPPHDFFRRVAMELSVAQPSMAAVRNVCDRWLKRVESGESPTQAARRTTRELRLAQQATIRNAVHLINNQHAVLTYSASSTVEAALILASKMGRKISVLCSEGRPMCEGRAMARRLAQRGLHVEFFTDAGLLASLHMADTVLVGCDAMFPTSFYNKVGTQALLRVARARRIPIYVVADTFKFLPSKAQEAFIVREEPAAEVWKNTQQNLRVHNAYFEAVPLSLTSGVVSELEVFNPGKVPSLIREMASMNLLRYPRKRRGG